MTEIVLYFLLFLVSIWFLEKVPGISIVAKPIYTMTIAVLGVFSLHLSMWILWFFRMFIRSHKTIFTHLLTRREDLNKAEVARRIRKKT